MSTPGVEGSGLRCLPLMPRFSQRYATGYLKLALFVRRRLYRVGNFCCRRISQFPENRHFIAVNNSCRLITRGSAESCPIGPVR